MIVQQLLASLLVLNVRLANKKALVPAKYEFLCFLNKFWRYLYKILL